MKLFLLLETGNYSPGSEGSISVCLCVLCIHRAWLLTKLKENIGNKFSNLSCVISATQRWKRKSSILVK